MIYAFCIAIFQRYYSRFFENHFIYHVDIKAIITVSSLNLSVSQNSFITDCWNYCCKIIPAAKCLIVIRASMNCDMKVLYSFFLLFTLVSLTSGIIRAFSHDSKELEKTIVSYKAVFVSRYNFLLLI